MPRGHDDVFTYVSGQCRSQTAAVPHSTQQHEHLQPASAGVHEAGGPTWRRAHAEPLTALAQAAPAVNNEQFAHAVLGTPSPEEPLTATELSFIMRAIQGLVGEFLTVELGGVADRPEALRKWRYATTTALESAGPQVTTWWHSCWEAAEDAHSVYMQAPVMNREGLKVVHRPSAKYAQIESWIKPRLIASMPQGIKRQLTARGVQGVRDEVCDILYLLQKSCYPGVAGEKQAFLKHLQTPQPCSKS